MISANETTNIVIFSASEAFTVRFYVISTQAQQRTRTGLNQLSQRLRMTCTLQTAT